MTCDHPYAEWAASYALGALDAQDRRAFEQHLQTCEVCQSEVTLFAPIPGLLSRIEPSDLLSEPSPSMASSIETRARDEHLSTRRQMKRWRIGALVASAAAAVLAMAILIPRRQTDPAPEFANIVTTQADTTEILATPMPWGTEIKVELTGLPQREEYELWAVDDKGEWFSAATWAATADGTASLVGMTSTPTKNLDRIVVTSADKGDVLVDTNL